MPNFSRRTKIISAFFAIVVAGYAVVKFTDGKGGVPQNFIDARMQGAIIAQSIVNLSNQSTEALTEVNKFDNQAQYSRALNLTADLVTKSQDIRDQAVQLSAQVEEMTKALSDISDFNARQAALESIANRLALINQLINYSGDLGKLLDLLNRRFSRTGGSPQEVQAMVNQINTDVNAINNFNSQAGRAMDRFDAIVAGK